MKRAISMLGAVAVAASFILSTQAQASHPNTPTIPPVSIGCSLVTDLSHLPAPNGWPRDGHYYYCGTATATYKTSSGSTVGTMPAKLKTVLRNRNTWLLITDTPAEVNTYLGTSIPAAGVDGATSLVTFLGVPYIFISSWETVPSNEIGRVLQHEVGHAFDYAYGAQIGTPLGVSNDPNSAFWDSVQDDWDHINGLARNVVFPHGVPNRKIDQPGGTWSDYDEGPAEGQPGAKTNQQILTDLYPWIFASTPTASKAKGEFFAHLYTQYHNAFINADNPYMTAAEVGSETLNWSETFTHFVNTAETNTTSYFGVMWTDPDNFTP